jgi:hypothetical protein
VPFDLDAGQGRWRIDLSVWLRDLYTAVLDDGVRTPEQFGRWLAANDVPAPDR